VSVIKWRAILKKVGSITRRLTQSSASSATSGLIGSTTSTEIGSRTDTEFTAEVVRVTRVLPHPNADRLEILRFEMKDCGETTYEVVSQKGTFKPGDLAAYFSVDCLLPTSHPDFSFLLSRLDGVGKETYRLRAARLRGTFSQGLLVPCPSGMNFGDAVADAFGVTYYRAPEPNVPTAGSGGIKKVKEQPFPIYTVESLKKVPRLFEEGERVCVTEKIHGTNFRFGWVRRKVFGIPLGWKFVVGSHRTIRDGGKHSYYGDDIYSQYAQRNNLAARVRAYKGSTFYGELFGYTYDGGKIQDLTYGRSAKAGPGLVIFDIRDHQGDWLDPWTRRNLCADLELEHVPVISIDDSLTTTAFNLDEVKKLAEGKSLLDPKQLREGVVVENADGMRRKAKFVGEGYLMRKDG
jgi:RNA ligase (TIGR02306 family)